MYRILKIGLYLIAISAPSSAIAKDSYFAEIKKVAVDKGIDIDVFTALIQQESGDPKNDFAINPFALNIGGRSYYPSTRIEAYQMLISAVMDGETNIGVGAGQLEWFYHGDKFGSLWNALDVNTNLNGAADYYLQMQKSCSGDVWCAVGKYHNQYPAIAAPYITSVKDKWQRLKKQLVY